MEPEQIYTLLHGFQVKPTYFVTTPFKMTHDTNILAEDCYWSKQCSVISSPNFPEAGLGLVNRKKKTIPRGTYFQYWGTVYLHSILDGNVMENTDLPVYVRNRLVKPLFQPFLHKGFILYFTGSLSCAASYVNDATYGNNPCNVLNNSIVEQISYPNPCGIALRVDEFMQWVMNAPMSIKTVQPIPYKGEVLAGY